MSTELNPVGSIIEVHGLRFRVDGHGKDRLGRPCEETTFLGPLPASTTQGEASQRDQGLGEKARQPGGRHLVAHRAECPGAQEARAAASQTLL